MKNFEALKHHLGQVSDLGGAASVLSWEQETYMPAKGAEHRADQMATLSLIHHQMATDPKIGVWLEELKPLEGEDTFEGAFVRVARRNYERETKFPAEFVEETSRAQNAAHHAWLEARKHSDFKHFEPHLEKMFELARRAADYLGFEDHPYDALLDLYEPGAKTAHIKSIFADLRDQTLPLLKAIQAKVAASGDVADYSLLSRKFPLEGQKTFGLKVAQRFGLEPEFARQDVSAHPFCTNFGYNDIRITTRFDEHFFPTSLFGTWHETGHGMYEHGVNPQYNRTPLAGGTSLGVHESQSRLFENLVGRSKAFWEFHFEDFKATFPEPMNGVTLDEFYKAINRVQADLIRVEADEVTYNFHVMLRFEIEVGLLEGSIQVKDLPEIWNAKMQDYLGVVPPSDALGVLQDVHWSAGLIGYFATYSLGNLLSVQLYNAAQLELGNLHDQYRKGELAPTVEWMRKNVHQHGSRYLPHEIAQMATGKPLGAADYVKYLKEKYSEIYGLEGI